MCLRALNYVMSMCNHFSCAYVPIYNHSFLPSVIKQATSQVNAIGRIQKDKGFKEKEVLLNSFVYSNFDYCPLVWHFWSFKSLLNLYIKWKKIQ